MSNNVVIVDRNRPDTAIIKKAANIICHGGIVAFPTETVYGLGANALDISGVQKIFSVKSRPNWDPLIVHVTSIEMAVSLCKYTTPLFLRLSEIFWPGPLTFVVKKSDLVPDAVTANRETVAIRMPNHPVICALLIEARVPIAAPSANRFGCPSPTMAEHVATDLGDQVDLILDAGPTPVGIESTVLDLTRNSPVILRPGGVNREELENILGSVSVANSVSDGLAKHGLKGPGMVIKHYAPHASLELFEGDPVTIAEKISARKIELQNLGKKVGVIPYETNLDIHASKLFSIMRKHDQDKVDTILCALPPPEGIGLAIRDRLFRASGKPHPYSHLT